MFWSRKQKENVNNTPGKFDISKNKVCEINKIPRKRKAYIRGNLHLYIMMQQG